MSPSVWVVRRVKAAGTWIHSRNAKPDERGDVRWVVRYRTHGGSEVAPRHGGTFRRRADAEARERVIAGLIAEGRLGEIRRLLEAPAGGRTIAELMDGVRDATPDASKAQIERFRKSRAALALTHLGSRHVDDVTRGDVQEWINAAAERYAPSTVGQYLTPIRQAIDHADLPRPNVARDPRLRLPLPDDDDLEEFSPPSYTEWLAILEAMTPKHRPMLQVIERTGMRMKEVRNLTWGDVDWAGNRLRVARGRTKRRSGGQRFIPLAPEVADILAGLRAPEDRVGVIFGTPHSTFGQALARACRRAGVVVHSPHDLRGRYLSLLLIAGVPIELVSRIGGHRKTSMTLEQYSHVLVDEPRWRLRALRRDVSVMFGLSALTPSVSEELDDEGGEAVTDASMGCTGLEPVTPSLSSWCSPN